MVLVKETAETGVSKTASSNSKTLWMPTWSTFTTLQNASHSRLQLFWKVGLSLQRVFGHSARAANILIKVRASCRSHQIPHSLLYSARGRGNDKNTGALYVKTGKFEIEQNQRVSDIDSTVITCKKGVTFKDSCSLPDDYTWHKKSEEDRVYLVRGKDRGKQAWHYVLVVDDEEMVEMFLAKVKSGNVEVADYGQVLKSGWGQEPPDEVREWIKKKYSP